VAAARDGGEDDARAAPVAWRTEVTQVATKVLDPDTPREVYPRQLAKRVGQILTGSSWFLSAAQPVPEGVRARPATIDLLVRYDVVDDGSGGKEAVAAVTCEVEWQRDRGGLPLRASVLSRRPVGADEMSNLDGVVAGHVARTSEAAARELVAREALRRGPDDAVIAALDADDPGRVQWALAIVGDRPVAAARQRVEALLSSDSREVSDAAIGALVAIGDARSVPALTALAEFGDYERMRMLIEAVSAIGGDEAIQFLEFVASGHPDPDIARRARDGLARVHRRRSKRGGGSREP
jgi:hypothetical protein